MAPLISGLLASIVPVAVLASSNTSSDLETLFREFTEKYGRSYASPEERAAHFATFTDNLEHMENFRRIDAGSAVYSHLTPFADLSPEEFSARHGLLMSNWKPNTNDIVEHLNASDLPISIDWRSKGAVNPPKNQGGCGSCWAFGTVANIEGAGFVQTGKLLSLSEQELVDCDHDDDEGCNGGLPSSAYKAMIKHNLGLELEAKYPYAGADDKCAATKSKQVAFISGWKQISTDETQIAAALVKYGPLAIGLNAMPMQFYFGGVSSPWRIICSPSSIDHAVTLVGFGTQKGWFGGKEDFWIIRHSWGSWWGEGGYYRLIRGTGACGMNTMVTTATGISFHAQDSIVV